MYRLKEPPVSPSKVRPHDRVDNVDDDDDEDVDVDVDDVNKNNNDDGVFVVGDTQNRLLSKSSGGKGGGEDQTNPFKIYYQSYI